MTTPEPPVICEHCEQPRSVHIPIKYHPVYLATGGLLHTKYVLLCPAYVFHADGYGMDGEKEEPVEEEEPAS